LLFGLNDLLDGNLPKALEPSFLSASVPSAACEAPAATHNPTCHRRQAGETCDPKGRALGHVGAAEGTKKSMSALSKLQKNACAVAD